MDYEGIDEEKAAVEAMERQAKLREVVNTAQNLGKTDLRERLHVSLPDTDNIKELAQAATPAAIRALVNIVVDEDASPTSKIAASTALLDRAHGKPHQAVDLSARVQFNVLPAVTLDDGTAVDFGLGKPMITIDQEPQSD